MDPLQLTISAYRVGDRIEAVADNTIDALYPSTYQVFHQDIADRLTHVFLSFSSTYPRPALLRVCKDRAVPGLDLYRAPLSAGPGSSAPAPAPTALAPSTTARTRPDTVST